MFCSFNVLDPPEIILFKEQILEEILLRKLLLARRKMGLVKVQEEKLESS